MIFVAIDRLDKLLLIFISNSQAASLLLRLFEGEVAQNKLFLAVGENQTKLKN